LEYGQFSAFHQIASDEGWHFYDGDPLTVYEIQLDGKLIIHKLGRNLDAGESFQCMIKAGSWFGSRCETQEGFSLVGCTVAPGFDFADFSLADRQELSRQFPQHSTLIESLTY
jgi:predicted cupin superfamily sugar epimerase